MQHNFIVSASGFGGGLSAGGSITADQFMLGSAATDASDRFIYNQNTGQLFFDVDSTGSLNQRLVVTLAPSGNTNFSNNDISVIA